MRDRTLIIFGLLFLALNIGAGVTWALNSGSGTFGEPLGPNPRELINGTAPVLIGAAEYGRERIAVFFDQGLEKIQTLAQQGKDQAVHITERFLNRLHDLLNSAGEKTIAQKNKLTE